MKDSNGISPPSASRETARPAAVTGSDPHPTWSRPSPSTKDHFALSGPSDLPDPRTNAYRADLADVALVGRVIASHYAEPVERHLIVAATLRGDRGEGAPAIAELAPGDSFYLLDDTLGWAWGYGGKDRVVGYVPRSALGR